MPPTRRASLAYGVGPGNAPCYVESSADVAKAADDILAGKCFDNGVLCSSPNSIVVDRAVASALRAALAAGGGHFLAPPEVAALARALVSPERLPNPALVGKSARHIAAAVGLAVPEDTRALIAPLAGVGRDHPLSIEKLCPVLSYYEVADWREGCERAKQILRYGGMGHTMSIHSRDDRIVLEFGLHKPAFRICVNTPTTHGSIGLTTGLDPALTLGCGGYGGNITSDNISPRHLLNIKRLAYEVRPRPGAAWPPGGRLPGRPPPPPHPRRGPSRRGGRRRNRSRPTRYAPAWNARSPPGVRRRRRRRRRPVPRGPPRPPISSAKTTCAGPHSKDACCLSARARSSRRPRATSAPPPTRSCGRTAAGANPRRRRELRHAMARVDAV
ncbi:MAG: hypothetical protein R2708_22790 [Vicinamibacterales bacterium]